MTTIHVSDRPLAKRIALMVSALAAGLTPPTVATTMARLVPRRHGKRGPYMPHQGQRECARRRGSWDWLDYRVADRVRRGLPPVPAGEG